MIYTLYKTTNNVNNKIYIGVHKTNNPNDAYLGSGKLLKDAIKFHGKACFNKEILYTFDNLHDAYAKEAEIVNENFIKREDTYNLIKGGCVSPDWLESRKLSFSQRYQKENHPQYGKKQSKESNAKRSKALMGKTRSKEQYEKALETKKKNGTLSSKLKGCKQSAESNAKRSKAHYNLEKIQCPICKNFISPQNAKRWHFDKCKPNRKFRGSLKN